MRAIYIACSFILCLIPTFSSAPNGAQLLEGSPEQKIAIYLQSNVSSLSSDDIYGGMKKHFQTMKLITPEGHWAASIAEKGDTLLPKDVSPADLALLINRAAANMGGNTYMHNALLAAEQEDLSSFYKDLHSRKEEVVDAVIYAMALENLTKTMREDVHFSRALLDLWDREGQAKGTMSRGFLYGVKYHSVRHPARAIVSSIENQRLDPAFFSYALPVNILEASFIDWLSNNKDNAKAGVVLAQTSPDGKFDASTGKAPANLSKDGKGIQIHPPFEREWADLYSSWNVAFVASLLPFPKLLAKLVIPGVSGYADTPSEYMQDRVLALFATMNHELHDTEESKRRAPWDTQQLTACLGKANKNSAENYKALLSQSAANHRPQICSESKRLAPHLHISLER
jgi:hypothetical protein